MDSLILLSFVLKRLYRSDDENRFNEKWRNCRMNANSSAFAQAGRRLAGSRWSMIIGSIPSRRSNERATSGNAFSSERARSCFSVGFKGDLTIFSLKSLRPARA